MNKNFSWNVHHTNYDTIKIMTAVYQIGTVTPEKMNNAVIIFSCVSNDAFIQYLSGNNSYDGAHVTSHLLTCSDAWILYLERETRTVWKTLTQYTIITRTYTLKIKKRIGIYENSQKNLKIFTWLTGEIKLNIKYDVQVNPQPNQNHEKVVFIRSDVVEKHGVLLV